LEEAVAERTAEKDRLIREVNHRVGNQLQVMNSLVRLEKQRSDTPEVLNLLHRLETELLKMNDRHHVHSKIDYLGPSVQDDTLLLDHNNEQLEPPKLPGS
jgi:two-component sensor histidine kinase